MTNNQKQIVAQWIDGLSIKEISEQSGFSISTVVTAISKGWL